MPGTSNHELDAKIAVVTGASSGIGRATALELASAGAAVLIHARRSVEAAQAVVDQLIQLGVRSEVLLADLADPAAHEGLVERAWAWQGRVDIWINNAGADVLTGPAAKWSFERKLEALWNVDVQATLSLSRAVGQRMKRRGSGAIVNTGWDQAETGMAGDSGEMFAAAKGAIMAFTRSLARSLAPEVRVNCVAPGWIKTAWGQRASEDWQQRARSESLLDRWGTPEDVARVTRWLVSPAAGFVTGHIVPVNGGFKNTADKSAG